MRFNPFAVLILLAACTQAAASNLYTSINHLRGGGATCARAAALPSLQARPELERAAAAIARGGALGESVANAGYRATRASVVNISGGGYDDEQLSLLERKYCATLLDPATTEIGIYQDARQLLIVFASPFAPAVADSPEEAGRVMLALVNNARAVPRTCGDQYFNAARPLRWNGALAQAARRHAEDMARYNYFSHQGDDGSTPAQRVARAGYRYRAMGENIAGGQETPEKAVAGWIRSPAHCANLMDPAFSEMGIDFATSKTSRLGVYWVQEFGAPR